MKIKLKAISDIEKKLDKENYISNNKSINPWENMDN